jgi:4'-phosphopantetheinyl transferase
VPISRAPVLVAWARPRLPTEIDALLYSHLFDDADRQHLAAIRHEAARTQSATARALLRALVADHLGCAFDEVAIDRTCPTCGAPHGKPQISRDCTGPDTPRLHVNTSHTAGLVLAALTTVGPVGIDVEAASSVDFDDFDHAALSASETQLVAGLPPAQRVAARALLWTRKEATLKASGVGLRRDPRTTEADPNLTVIDLDVADGYAAALAIAVPPGEHHTVEVTDANDYLSATVQPAPEVLRRTATA